MELNLRAFIACTGINDLYLYKNNVYLSTIGLPDMERETKQTCPSALRDVIEVMGSNDSAVVYQVA